MEPVMHNEEQIAYWNGEAGHKWAERDSQMSALLAPIAEALMEHADVEGSLAALDVGCGGGSETLMLARRLGSGARILGVDISEPLLAVAEAKRAGIGDADAEVAFLRADAAVHDFPAGHYDLLFSRFGVMFFDAPTEAFTNLRHAMAPGGALAFTCWQSLRDNPWTALPLQAALTVLPPPPKPEPHAPGPFAFADRDYLRGVLEGAGWEDVAIVPHTAEMRFAGSEGFESAVRELVNTGPVGRLLLEADEAQRQAVHAAAAQALGDYYVDDALVLPGAVWLVTASNGSH
jgi:SAM-dependent methyltransferase